MARVGDEISGKERFVGCVWTLAFTLRQMGNHCKVWNARVT